MLVGDFNCELYKQDISKVFVEQDVRSVLGESLPKSMSPVSDNQTRFMQFCVANNLAVIDSFFKKKDRLKFTYCSPDHKSLRAIDHLVCRRSDLCHYQDSQSFPTAMMGVQPSGSHHYAVGAQVKSDFLGKLSFLKKNLSNAEGRKVKVLRREHLHSDRMLNEGLVSLQNSQGLMSTDEVLRELNVICKEATDRNVEQLEE